MMEILLVIFMELPGQPAVQTKVGLMNGPVICDVVGRAMLQQLLSEAPAAKVGYACVPQVSA